MNAVGLIIYPATDIAASRAFFAALLGSEPYADTPYYVGFKAGDVEIGLVPQGMQPSLSGALVYATVDDINAALAALTAAGAETVQEVTDVSQGLLVASVKDPHGTVVGLRQFPKT